MRTDPEISWYPVPDRDELPDDIAKLFAKAEAVIGFVPNVFQAFAYRVDHFRAWFSHFKQLHVPSEHLSAADREMIAVVVSMANGCLYCLVAHGQALREALDDPVLADRITLDEAWDCAEISAMYNFTNRLAMATGQIPNREYHSRSR